MTNVQQGRNVADRKYGHKVRCERTADIHYTWFKHEPELYCLAVSVLRFTRSAVQKIGLKSSH